MRTREVTDGLSPEQLPGACHDADRASYSLAEVAKHDSSDDGWIVVHGSVYDVTNFIKHHPGWNRGGQTSTVLAIMRTLGTDCSEEFDSIHSAHAQRQLKLYRIGALAQDDDDGPRSSAAVGVAAGRRRADHRTSRRRRHGHGGDA